MRRLVVLFLLVLSAWTARAQNTARDAARDDAALPESSRWISFARLVEGRWRTRTEVPATDQPMLRRQYRQCIEDAWYLALPPLLGAQAPCTRLLVALNQDGDDAATDGGSAAALRDRWRSRFATALASPERHEFLECAEAAATKFDTALLRNCALALRPRAIRLVRMTDDERFGTWLSACKKGILRTEPAAPRARGAELEKRRELDDEMARHCLRTFPALYEVQWLKKLSDFWTPEEQRALYQRAQQLGER